MVEQRNKAAAPAGGETDHEEAIVPIRPGLGAGDAPPVEPTPSAALPTGRRRDPTRLALAALGVLLLLAFGVVFLLPRWVAQQPEQTPTVAEPVAPAPVATEVPGLDPELLAQLEATAEQRLAQLLTQQGELEALAVARWGGADWSRHLELAREGDDAFLAQAYEQAVPKYDAALALGEQLKDRATDILSSALTAGEAALVAGDAQQAGEQFDLALAIQADNAAALTGAARAANLNQVLQLMAEGRAAEAADRFSEAIATYDRVLELDRDWQPAREARLAVQQRLARANFDAAMSAGLTALSSQDFDAAAEAFQRALGLRPGAQEALDGLEQADQGKRLNRIALARVRAAAFERQELWDEAMGQYRAALALDPTVSFAQEGLARASARSDLEKKLLNLIERPRLLFSDQVLADARTLITEARAVTNEPGPRLKEQVVKLSALVTQASTPIAVRLFSDNLTEVTVYRVGELGTFDVRDLKLRPGRYTLVGSRDGYRDVREILEIMPGAVPDPVTVQCVDRI